MGDTLSGEELAAQLLERMSDTTVQLTTTVAGATTTCVASNIANEHFSIRDPARGISEMRVVRNTAYLEDRPGTSTPWFEFDLSSGQTQLPTQEMADALNRIAELQEGDCRWNERLAAIDTAGKVAVTAATGGGYTLTVPTDPESQRDKNSASRRPYARATWTLDADGRPASYRAADGSREVRFSKWDVYEVVAPPPGQVRR